MTALRKLLIAVMALVVALAPAVASAAVRMPAAQDSAVLANMPDCHKPATEKSALSKSSKPAQNHCNHCTDDSGCAPEACALKCFQLLADFGTPVPGHALRALLPRPLSLHQPPGWLAAPPAPPPRA